MSSKEVSTPAEAGVIDSLRALSATLLALIRTRAELIALELQEENERRKQMLLLAVVAALFFAMGLLLVAFFLVVLFWDTYRLLAIGSVTALYLGIGGWALFRLREKVSNSPPPFAATLKEFERDMDALRGSNESVPENRGA